MSSSTGTAWSYDRPDPSSGDYESVDLTFGPFTIPIQQAKIQETRDEPIVYTDRPTWSRLKQIIDFCSVEKKSTSTNGIVNGTSLIDRQLGNVLWAGFSATLQGKHRAKFYSEYGTSHFLTKRCADFSKIVKKYCDDLDEDDPLSNDQGNHFTKMTKRAITALVSSARGHDFPYISKGDVTEKTASDTADLIQTWYNRAVRQSQVNYWKDVI